MENSIGIANDSERGEVQRVDGEVSELTEKENLDTSVDGFKDTDEDEVFEEAIESQTPKIDSESSKVIDDGNTELIGTLENIEDTTNPAIEVQKLDEVFEEAIDSESSDIVEGGNIELKKDEENPNLASEIQKPNEVFEEAIEADIPMIDSENSKIIEGGDDELIGTLNNDEDYSSLMSEIQKFEEMNGGTEAAQGSEHSRPSSEFLTSEEHPVETKYAAEKFVKDEANALLNENKVEEKEATFEKLLNSSSTEVNNELDNFPQNGVSDNAIYVRSLSNEDSDTVDVDTGEKSIVDMLETQESHELNGAEAKTTDIEGNIHEMAETQDGNEVKVGDIGSVKPENGVLDHVNVTDTSNVGCTNIGEVENTVKGSESGPTKASGDVIHNDEENATVSDAGPRSESESDGRIMHKDEKELGLEGAKFQKVDSPATNHVEQKSGHDTSLPPVVEDDTRNLETEKVEKVVDASIEVPKAVALEPENGEINDEAKEKCISGIPKQEVAPVTGLSSSSGMGKEAVSQAKSVNVEQEAKIAADVSSSSKSATISHPAGLGHTVPLLESIQKIAGNKENGSKSAANNLASAASARPAGLGRAAPLLEPTSRVVQQPRVNGAISATQNQLVEDHTNGDAEEYDETREKLQMIRVKFLRLAHRLGQTPHNVVVAQVLYRLGLAEQLRGRSGGRVAAFSFDRASAMAEQLEAAGQEPLDFTCTIMVLGKSGVGKSATINSIFDEVMFDTDAFQLGTKKVQDIVGTVQGIRVRVIDMPGLLPSLSDQRHNEKILRSVKKFINKTPPDIVLYLDRLDMQSRDSGDMPLLRTITQVFGPSIWFNAIVVLTHAASAPPEGPNGTATSYDMFVTQRSHVVQQAIRQAAGDMRLMNPVSLVENHSACRTNRAGQRVLPNGQVWKPHLLLLSFASKILAEANTLLKLQDSPPGRPFAPRTRSPPLPFLLSSLLQSRPEVKLPSEQFGDDDDVIDDDVDDSSESEDEEDYDELPAFKSLSKAQLEKLPKSQKKAYYDELEYREKLFMKKQLKEEKKRQKMMKKMAKDLPVDYGENGEEESGGAASVPVPMPDLALPASFDSDNPTHRYRSLDSNPWLIRAVLEPNGWDHDIGYDGINVERLFVAMEKIPISFSGHISKDKKDANLQMEIASSVKHGKGKSTSFGFDAQSAGKEMAYTVRSDTRFSNHKINKASAGFSATLLGDVLTGGAKIEDRLSLGKWGQIVVSGGGIYGRGDVALGGSLEATLRDKDHPLGRFLSTLGVSVMEWHGDLAIGCNSQTQIPIGRHSNLIARFNVNNRGSGQVSVRVNSSEQLQIVLIGLIPLIRKIIGT